MTEPATRHASLIEEAHRAGAFQRFLQALAIAGLTDILQGGTRYTVFAPVDSAIEGLPEATWAKLTSPEHRQTLKSVLTYHFAEGMVLTRQLRGRSLRAVTFEGRSLRIRDCDGIAVNRARIVRPDIEAKNGVLHGIDAVLWPKAHHSAVAPSEA